MLTSTFGVVVIVIVGMAALAALEGVVLYAALRPTWKTGRGASRDGLLETGELQIPADQESGIAAEHPVPVGAGH